MHRERSNPKQHLNQFRDSVHIYYVPPDGLLPHSPTGHSPNSLPQVSPENLFSEDISTVYNPVTTHDDQPTSYGLPPSHIPVDDDLDADSTYESDAASDTTSLRSAAMSYLYENGRRYHSYRAGSYWGPNDERAQDNLDLYHHVFTLSCDGEILLAPIGKNPQRVLDLGKGVP